jgi:hypothetical protein
VKQRTRPQQGIDRLAEWLLEPSKAPDCKLGGESLGRRGDACSACKPREDVEINREIARLIKLRAFKYPGVCPYRVVVSHLIAGLTVGPEASRARSVGQLRVDPRVEVKGVLKRIRSILYASGLSRDDIEAISISNDSDRWQALYAVLTAARALEKALALFQSQIPAKIGVSPRGRMGALHIQALARAMALAWSQLTGRLPAKENVKFQGLLLAAITSIFGDPAREPNLESAAKTAVERIRKDIATRS